MDVFVFGTMTSEVEAEHLDVVATFYPSCENATAVTDILQFNFSEFDYPGGGGPWPPPLGLISAMKITFCVINMIVSILGNCAVIIAVYHNPALRSTINFYLVNFYFHLSKGVNRHLWSINLDFIYTVVARQPFFTLIWSIGYFI